MGGNRGLGEWLLASIVFAQCSFAERPCSTNPRERKKAEKEDAKRLQREEEERKQAEAEAKK